MSHGSFGPVVKKISVKIFLFLALAAICSTEQKSLCPFGGAHLKEHFCELYMQTSGSGDAIKI